MSNQVTDIRRTVFGTFVINPKSTAGVLLREHDNVAQALAYAERKAKMLLAVHNPLGLDYAKAAEDLREEQKSQVIHPSQHATRRDEMSKRTDWTIKQYPFWTAIHNETGEALVARTREALMSKINEWDRA